MSKTINGLTMTNSQYNNLCVLIKEGRRLEAIRDIHEMSWDGENYDKWDTRHEYPIRSYFLGLVEAKEIFEKIKSKLGYNE